MNSTYKVWHARAWAVAMSMLFGWTSMAASNPAKRLRPTIGLSTIQYSEIPWLWSIGEESKTSFETAARSGSERTGRRARSPFPNPATQSVAGDSALSMEA